MQGRGRDADVENRLVDRAKEREGGLAGRVALTMCTAVCEAASQWQTAYDTGSSVLCDGPERAGAGGWGGRLTREGCMYTYG